MPRLGPGERATIGAAILAAAEVAEVHLIEDRLVTFAATHRRYLAAQMVVAAMEVRLKAARVALLERDRDQDQAVEEIAIALMNSGRPRLKPFAHLPIAPPASIRRLEMGAEAKEIHRLVAAVRRADGEAGAVLGAAEKAEAAANTVEQALAEIEDMEGTLRGQRRARDVIGGLWDRHLASLKRAARAAEDDGADDLFRLLF